MKHFGENIGRKRTGQRWYQILKHTVVLRPVNAAAAAVDIHLRIPVTDLTYRVVLVHLDAVASDEGGFTGGVHQQQQSVQPPERKSGEQHCPCSEGINNNRGHSKTT